MDWLARCIPDLENFLRHQWRQGPALLRPADPPVELLTPADLEALLDSGTLRTPYAGLFTVGGNVAEERYCTPRTVAGLPVYGYPDPVKVRGLIREESATLQLRYLNHWHPGVRSLTEDLGEQLGRLSEAFLFHSQPGRRGPVHRDDGDILVLQLSGAKHWEVYPGPTDASWQPVREEQPGAPLFEGVVRTGEVLYVPNGYAHRAWATEDGPSLHLTVVLREAGAGHLRAQLKSRLAEGLTLPARPLDDADLTKAAAELLDHLRDRLDELTPAELVSAARRNAHSSRPTA
ncbi:cupin domain-containing protein [Kitasatospora sp. NPDC002227]|uniref:JmjC domain-containing protein n=1 Tax=Kitasatospora sp. NPDC002227 TaxID=3154773 RepID=UPI00332A683C